jgi:cell division protein FtsB
VRIVIGVLLALTLYLQYALWFSHGGIRDVDKLKQAVREQKQEIARLKERNRALAAEVMDLKEGLEAIEERARSDMGMIKKGEVFFRLTEPTPPAAAAPAASAE